MLLSHIMHDVRSTTGLNLRRILLQTSKTNVDQLSKHDITELEYHPTTVDNKWKEAMVAELLEVRDNQLEVDGFVQEELDEMLEYICVR